MQRTLFVVVEVHARRVSGVCICSVVSSMPLRLALCVSNLQATLAHMAEHLSKAALAIRSAGRDILTQEDVIQVCVCGGQTIRPLRVPDL